MKTVPFLNEKGEQVGTATITEDGLEADITISADGTVLKALRETTAISCGCMFSSGDRDALKGVAAERRLFVAQEVKR